MLKIKELYTLPFKPVDLTSWVLEATWFPEMPDVMEYVGHESLEWLQLEGRLQVRELVNDYIDGSRTRTMHTVWFDNAPVFIVQAGGRGSRDHFKRWVTDTTQLWALLRYLQQHLVKEASNDAIDPEKLVYEEEVFTVYGEDVSERFGYKREVRVPGYLVLSGPPQNFVATQVEPWWTLVLVTKEAWEPAKFIRRDEFVMQLLRPLTAEEWASNPNLEDSGSKKGLERGFWYGPVKRGDVTEAIVSV